MSYLENLFSLDGKGAIVTGAARGNGRAIAEALLLAGADVLLVDILDAELERTCAELRKQGLNAYSLSCDLSQAASCKDACALAIKKFGHVDIVINNAGISLPKTGEFYSFDNWQRTLEVNVGTAFLLSTEAIKHMKDTGGSIINITSLNAEMAFPDNPAYMASKGALKQLGKSLALDYAKFNIRVNNIGPGYMRTAMTKGSWHDEKLRQERSNRIPMGRWGESNDLVGAVIFLSSTASTYITGQDIYVDGGWLIKGL